MLETAQHAYLAVVVDGTESAGFRSEMRERIIDVEHVYDKTLRQYDGDPTPLAPEEAPLGCLCTRANRLNLRRQKRLLLIMGSMLAVFFLGICAAGGWARQTLRPTPTPPIVAVVSTDTPSPTPSPTATPSPTSTFTPTLTPTFTPTATPTYTATPTPTNTVTPTFTPAPTPEPVLGILTGNVWLRREASDDSERIGIALEEGLAIEVLAVFDDWIQIRWFPGTGAEVIGWVPARWVGTTSPIPEELVTLVAGL